MTAFARTPVLPVATAVGALSAQCDVRRGDPECPVNVDFVEEPPVLVPALGICGDVSEADSWLSTSCGEDGRRPR